MSTSASRDSPRGVPCMHEVRSMTLTSDELREICQVHKVSARCGGMIHMYNVFV